MTTGANFHEIRVIDPSQLTHQAVATSPTETGRGCNHSGISIDDAAKEKFPAGWKPLKPYLRRWRPGK
jgi:hypothetical protein